MVDDRRYCVDIITQTNAAEAALRRVGEIILRKHLETCVMEAFRSGKNGDAQEKVHELVQVYRRCRTR
jgi:DNA-binding FrmR family transcriptional regulator